MTPFFATVPAALHGTTHVTGPATEWHVCQRVGCIADTGSLFMHYCSYICDETSRAMAVREADELAPIAWFDRPVRPAPSQPGDVGDGWRWTA